MVSRTDAETLRILDDVIILFVHANPDGNDLVADWYMRNPNPEERSLNGLPRLYQKYIGHDNNRDFFASTQAETENMNRVLYREWFPQLLYNHHQSGPAGTVLYSPPLRDPFNYNEDPLVVLGIEQLGNAMHTRLAAEGKPGATMRSGGPYDGWWNGGIRNTAAFHNTIAILTEMIGSPTPSRVPLVMERQLPTSDLAYPIAPQEWHFRQSIDYSISCNLAVLSLAANLREQFLYDRYAMGRHSIERGSQDTWTPRPHRYAAVEAAMASSGATAATTGRAGAAGAGGAAGRAGRAGAAAAPGGRGGAGGRGGRGGVDEAALWAALHAPGDRDPRAFIIPSDQPDFPTATRFVNALLETGIEVQRATRDFTVNGRSYPAHSYVVFTAQAFRPHVMDMFEPQDHPDNIPYPGAPPTHPYDNAGWTLAFQMGVKFDRILEGFSGPFEPIADWNVKPPAGRVTGGRAAGYLFSHQVLDAFVAVNRLLAGGEDVYSLTAPMTVGNTTYPAGSFYVTARPTTAAALEAIAADRGVSFAGTAEAAPTRARRLRAPRIGLWDQYGGSIDAGWTRWILEQFEFPFERVFAPALDAGHLKDTYDTLIFVSGAIPNPAGGGRGGRGGGRGGGGGAGGGAGGMEIPAEYRDQIGSVTAAATLPQIREFVQAGGTVIGIGSSATNLARFFDLPVENHLVENGQPLPQTKFYTPGSVLRAHVDTTQPLAYGMAVDTDVFFDNSPVYRLGPNAAAQGVRAVAWFDSKTPLRSGWAWGQAYLEHGVIAIDATVGAGHVLLFGPEILQRAQPEGTFKFLFNGIYEK